jgi:hypothetical protein
MKDLNRSISSPITIPYCNLVSTIIVMSLYVNIYFGQLSAISDQKFITKRGKLGKHEKLFTQYPIDFWTQIAQISRRILEELLATDPHRLTQTVGIA